MNEESINSAATQNAIVLANVACLISGVLREVGEKDISRSLGGETLTRDMVEQTVLARVTSSIK